MRFNRIKRRALTFALFPVTALAINAGASTATAQEQAQIEPSQKAVRIGGKILMRGEFPGSPQAKVAVLHRPAGTSGFRRVATTRTYANERWQTPVRPRSTGGWRARVIPEDSESDEPLASAERPVEARRTTAKRVRVGSKTRVRAAKRHTVAGNTVRIRGRVAPAGTRRVVVRVGGQELRTRTNRRGRFSTKWQAPSTGTYGVKALARGNRTATASRDRGGRITAYRHASASWYGPGLYGNRTACGQTLSPGTKGVAHKTMPCGTKLRLRHSGNTVNVRVIDRGPYVHGREFDLTEATRNELGFGSTGTVLSSR